MINSLKKCKKCKKFFDYKNINFCLNVAISEKLEIEQEEQNKEYLEKMLNLMIENTGIQWCKCNIEEKRKYIKEAEEYLSNNINKKETPEELGFDFKLDEDILYITNKNNFNSFVFLKYIKSLKKKLKETELLKFDFLNFDKLTSREFNYKEYYSKPDFLLIYDFENLQEENIDLIIKINNIIKQRKSNNKRTFVVSINKLENLEKFLITRFYTKDEHIILEFFNLLKNSFKLKIITTIENKNEIKINTSNIRKRQIKKKSQKEEIDTSSMDL